MRGLRAVKPDMSPPVIPGMLPRDKKTSPAKSLASMKSWSITVKEIHAPFLVHCLRDTLLQSEHNHQCEIV